MRDIILDCFSLDAGGRFKIPLTTYIVHIISDARYYLHGGHELSVHELAFAFVSEDTTEDTPVKVEVKLTQTTLQVLLEELRAYLESLPQMAPDTLYETLLEHAQTLLEKQTKTNNPILRLEKEIARYDTDHAWLGSSIVLAFNLRMSDVEALIKCDCILDVRPLEEKPAANNGNGGPAASNGNTDDGTDERVFSLDSMIMTPIQEEPADFKDIYGLSPELLKSEEFKTIQVEISKRYSSKELVSADEAFTRYFCTE